jgi:hypothetical protein
MTEIEIATCYLALTIFSVIAWGIFFLIRKGEADFRAAKARLAAAERELQEVIRSHDCEIDDFDNTCPGCCF